MKIYKKILDDYLSNNIEESNKFINIYQQVKNEDEINLINRKNFTGHFTASAYVITKNSKKVLMIYHKILKNYLQPGGHIDLEDKNPLESAKREFSEETGIDKSLLKYKPTNQSNELVPLNISIHRIPENKNKKESSHLHYDLQYLFLVENEIKPDIDLNEVDSYKWVECDDFKNMKEYKNISQKIERIL